MKRYIVFVLAMLSFANISFADSRIKRVSPAVYADLELPFRCVLSGTEKQISNTVALTPDDFSFLPFNAGDTLPRYAVQDYHFEGLPINKVLDEILSPLKIKVVAPKTEFPCLDGQNVNGELSAVVTQLAEASDVFYTYKASTKTLTLLRRTEYVLTVPKYKSVLMAMLDALRGSGVENLTIDWEKYQIHMVVSMEELQKAQQLVQRILKDSYLLSADIETYQAVPYPRQGEWQAVFNQSAPLIATVGRAVTGRSVVLNTRTQMESFLDKVRANYQLTPLVAGQAVVPNGWQMRFNLNECSNNMLPYPDMSVVIKTKIKDHDHEQSEVTLNTSDGVLTTFNFNSSLNQEIALVGIPTKVGNTELLFTMKFNLVRFVQKGE